MRHAVVLALLGTVTASGCGGGERLSKEEYVGKANALCRDSKRQVTQLGKPKSQAETVDALREGDRITDRLLPRLEALKPPQEDEADLERFIARLRDGQAVTRRLTDALASMDRSELQDIVAEARGPAADIRSIGQRQGLTDCLSETPAPGG